MKDKIMQILDYESCNVYDDTGDEHRVVEKEDFDNVAEKVVKLFAIPDVLMRFCKYLQDTGTEVNETDVDDYFNRYLKMH